MLHAAILLECANGMSDSAVAVARGVNGHTVALCIRKFLQFGIDAALRELPRPGKSRRIADDAIAWVLHCACQKPKDLSYSYELWTYALLQSHVRKHCMAASHPSLLELSRSKLHRIQTQGEVLPHRVRYYVERRDPEFDRKMIEVLHVYNDVAIVNAGLVEGTLKEPSTVTISYDEKPGIQALARTAPDRPPAPNQYPSHLRDYEYKRLGTVSLLDLFLVFRRPSCGRAIFGGSRPLVGFFVPHQSLLKQAAGRIARPTPPSGLRKTRNRSR